MTQLDQLRDELAELQEIIHELGDTSGLEDWSAEWAMVRSLLSRQAALLHRIDVLSGEFEFEVALTGEPVVQETVDAGFAGDFLSRLQSTVASVVQSLVHGPQERGRFPADVLAASRLKLVATGPGSFRLGLAGPPRAAQDSLLDTDVSIPAFDEAVGMVMDVFDAAESDVSGEVLTAAIAHLGSHRAVTHLTELSNLLASWGAAANTVMRSHFLPDIRESRWTPSASRRLAETLSRVERVTETIHESGRLVGVRWTNHTFDLEVGEGEEAVIISGKIVRAIRDAVRDAFDRNVSATLERTTTQTPVEVEDTVTYVLVEVREPVG